MKVLARVKTTRVDFVTLEVEDLSEALTILENADVTDDDEINNTDEIVAVEIEEASTDVLSVETLEDKEEE